MSLIGSEILAGASGQAGAAAYEIEQSLRFEPSDNHSLSRTFSSAGNQKTFTLSLWVKRSHKQTFSQFLVSTAIPSGWSGNYYLELYGNGPEITEIAVHQGRNSGLNYAYTNRKLRDFSGWYHIVYVADYSNATADDRFRLYVNGQRDTSFRVSAAFADEIGSWNAASVAHYIGKAPSATTVNFGGYLAEFHHVDGQVLDPTDFGEYDDNGVWRPIRYTGSYGTNGFYLKFDPSATNGIGHDHSGNGNNWTANNFTTSGTGTDVMSDTPTTNWCTLNPLAVSSSISALSEGNLKGVSPAGGYGNTFATMPIPSSGKWYWEVEGTATTHPSTLYLLIGVSSYPIDSTNIFQTSNAVTYYSQDGTTYADTINSSYGASYGIGDVIGVACDADAGTITFYKNGTSQGSISHTMVDMVPAVGDGFPTYQATFICNFGQRAFEQTPPTGYLPLNTANLPAPDIADGSEYFNTVLWTGNATARDITTGHNSNFTWIKHRSAAENHNLYDILRGVGNRLESNQNSTETNYTDRLTAFNSDGFSLGTGYNNTTSTTYVGWSWAGGGSGSSNTNGSITSTVSANPTAGFSIVSYTGTGANATVGHGLGVAPSLVMIKNRDTVASWIVGTTAVSGGFQKFLSLDTTAAIDTRSDTFNNTDPTNTVFSLGTLAGTNNSGDDFVAYCFAEVEGYSKFGSYTGNGQNDPNCPFIYTGFKPAFLLTKCVTAASHWLMLDVARGQYYNPIGYKNSTKESLYASTAAAESGTGTGFQVDFLSNGFKIRATVANELNAPGETHIYAAFAENPFGGSGVSPATAR